jgi:hypothetical protein
VFTRIATLPARQRMPDTSRVGNFNLPSQNCNPISIPRFVMSLKMSVLVSTSKSCGLGRRPPDFFPTLRVGAFHPILNSSEISQNPALGLVGNRQRSFEVDHAEKMHDNFVIADEGLPKSDI